LFSKNSDHKHAQNYLKYPLFEYTKFARMGWDEGRMVYYSAGIERPEYNNSIRIMSRHTRDRNYDFGGWKADLKRGLETLDYSTTLSKNLGYKNIWVSREESPELLEYFSKHSKFSWDISHEYIPGSENWKDNKKQYILRKNE